LLDRFLLPMANDSGAADGMGRNAFRKGVLVSWSLS